jgi:GT2 family glycosyltransferase
MIIEEWGQRLQSLEVIINDNRYVAHALNLAIPRCTSDIIVRIDAHTKYSKDYFQTILSTFNTVDAEIIGGPTRTAFKTPFQEAVAFIFNTSLGMGNSSVHNIKFNGYTDSVTFGAWRRDIFKTTGLFDIQLRRNQDDEFHYRAKSKGFKIYQNSEIKLWYYPRDSWRGLMSQYYQYGFYKPLVLKKNMSGFRLRHIVPSIFVLYLTLLLITVHFFPFVLIPLFVYLVLIGIFMIKSKISLLAKLLLLVAYFVVHISYGSGFLLGLLREN